MKPETEKLFSRALECLDEADHLYKHDHVSGAVNRAYYAMFDCARAILHEYGVLAKTHQGVQL